MTKTWPDQEPRVVAKTLRYSDAQEHLLRRLGQAMVLQWDALTEAQQDLIVDQAAQVEDRDPAPHAAEDIEGFIRAVKVMALKPADAS